MPREPASRDRGNDGDDPCRRARRAARPARPRTRTARGCGPSTRRPHRSSDRRDRRPRPRRAIAHRCRRTGRRRRVGGRRAGREGVRLRPATTVPRRPRGRGGLDQRPEPGLRREAGPPRADQPGAHEGPGRRAGRTDAQELGPTGRPVGRSWTRCCPTGTGCTSSSRASAAASWRSTSASSSCGPPGCDDLVGLGSLTRAARRSWTRRSRAGLNMLVAGGTQAGR